MTNAHLKSKLKNEKLAKVSIIINYNNKAKFCRMHRETYDIPLIYFSYNL